MVCRPTFTAGIFLIVLRSHVGTWQIHKIVAPWTQLTFASQCTSSNPSWQNNSPSFQLVSLPASMTRCLESSTQSSPIRPAAASSQAPPQPTFKLAPFNPSTRVGYNPSSLVKDPRQVFLPDLLQFRDQVHSTGSPPLVHPQPHSGTSPPKRRSYLISTSMASTRKRKGTSKLASRVLS